LIVGDKSFWKNDFFFNILSKWDTRNAFVNFLPLSHIPKTKENPRYNISRYKEHDTLSEGM